MKNKLLKIAGFSAAAYTTAALYKLYKRNVDDTVGLRKKAIKMAKLSLPLEENYSNGVALTPPMGWSSWNTFRNKINEEIMIETAQAMKNSGLLDLGYCYLNLDDCWQSSMRTNDGRLQGDLVNFPSGIESLVQKINDIGVKVGIYSSNGTLTCEDMPASMGYEKIDAETFVQWGIEYFKYDFCHNLPMPLLAPKIEKISISKLGTKDETFYSLEDAVFTGDARIIEDKHLESGKYVMGLSSNAGTIEFNNIQVQQAGEYTLTFYIKKKSNAKKYAEIQVNSNEIYKTVVPPTRAFSPDGRHQAIVTLQKGINSIKIYNPIASRQDSAAYQYTQMGKYLKQATKEYSEKTGKPEKPIVYSICEWGLNIPWRWGKYAGNLWRTTPDIKAFWASILGIYEVNIRLYKYAQVGGWNDPDMLEVGNGSLSYEENKSHFTLWCMMAAPLILGNDLRHFLKKDGTADENNETLKIVSNKDLIDIDQDELGIQCRRIKSNGYMDTLIKPLKDNEVAVCFFNKADREKEFCLRINEVASKMYADLPFSSEYEIFDLWDKTTTVIEDEINAKVPAHGVVAYRIKAAKQS